jgi:hypothetical protein
VDSWPTHHRDVLGKLDRSDAAERQAFIVLPPFSTIPVQVLNPLWTDIGVPVPTREPQFRRVTQVWIAATCEVGSGLRWSAAEGLRRFGKPSAAETPACRLTPTTRLRDPERRRAAASRPTD